MAAQQLGAPAVIVMPTTAPQVKVDGAQVVRRGGDVRRHHLARSPGARRARSRRARAHDRAAVRSPADHRRAGHDAASRSSSSARMSAPSSCPIGGGGMISGVAAAIKLSKPSVRVVGVEPEGAPKMSTVARGRPADHAAEDRVSIADGLMTIRPGDITFAHVREFVDEVVTVPDEAIATAVAWLFRHARLVVEPSGAAATAAVMLGLGDTKGATPVVAVVSGGNVAPEAFARYVTRLGVAAICAQQHAPEPRLPLLGNRRHDVRRAAARRRLSGFRPSAARAARRARAGGGPSGSAPAARCSTPSDRARSMNQSIAEQSNVPVRP